MENIKNAFASFDVLKLKIAGFVGNVFLALAWSGIVKNSLLTLIFGILGASSLTIFIFLMNESLKMTHSVTLYMLRLLGASVICAFPYFMIYHTHGTDYGDFHNYLSLPFTVFFCLGSVYIIDKWKDKPLKLITLFIMCIFALIIKLEFGPLCILLAYFIHEYDGPKNKRLRNFNIYFFFLTVSAICLIMLAVGKGDDSLGLAQTATFGGCVLGVPLINRYNGKITESESPKEAKLVKWGSYVVYFLMLVFFAVLKYFLVS